MSIIFIYPIFEGIVLDGMSQTRSLPNLASFGTVDRAINCVLSAVRSVCPTASPQGVFDSWRNAPILVRSTTYSHPV